MAKQLNEIVADDRVILSRGARCRLSSDLEADLQRRGLQVLSSSFERVGEVHFIALKDERDPKPMKATKEDKALPQSDQTLCSIQMALLEAQEELAKSRRNMAMTEQQLKMTQLQASEARQETQLLRDNMRNAQAQKPPTLTLGAPSTSSDTAKEHGANAASLLFLQWQNAHLQADLRQMQQALANTKTELQMQVMTCQQAESKHGQLQARIEHLELDLGLKAAFNAASNLDHRSEAWQSTAFGLSPSAGHLTGMDLRGPPNGAMGFSGNPIPGEVLPDQSSFLNRAEASARAGHFTTPVKPADGAEGLRHS